MCAPRDYPSYIWTFLFCFWAAGHRLWLYPLSYSWAFWPFVVFGYHQQSQYKQPHRESVSTSLFKIFWDVIVLDYIGFLFFSIFFWVALSIFFPTNTPWKPASPSSAAFSMVDAAIAYFNWSHDCVDDTVSLASPWQLAGLNVFPGTRLLSAAVCDEWHSLSPACFLVCSLLLLRALNII